MNTLFFDTETTGLKKDKLDDIHPSQPLPVQIGMKLDDANFNERAAFNYCLQPKNRWVVSPKAAEITGIDNAVADAYGCNFITGIEMFLDMMDNADNIVAHNIGFDITVMRRAVAVYSSMTDQPYADPFAGKTVTCTMLNSVDEVKATPMRYGRYKWPKLEECMQHFFNERLDGAHDALVDVRGCSRVYYKLKELGII